MGKIIPKRTTLLQKSAYILRPFVVYMLAKTVAMLFLAIFISSLPITGITEWVEHNTHLLSAVVNGVASLIAVLFLLNDFLIEASTTGEVDIDKNISGQFASFLKTDFVGERTAHKMIGLGLCAMFGITASLALNILIELVSVSLLERGIHILDSQKYEAVESVQYSVPIWLGIILYGILSPIVEEVVFRGVIYSRIRKFYSMSRAVVFSALLFGIFHANLPQFLYGTAMGALIAVCYQYSGCFASPVLVHMSANIFVFLMSELTSWASLIYTPVWCVFFIVVTVILLLGIIKISANNKTTQAI